MLASLLNVASQFSGLIDRERGERRALSVVQGRGILPQYSFHNKLHFANRHSQAF